MGDLGITAYAAIASAAIAAVGTGVSVAANVSASKRAQQNAVTSLRNTDTQLRVAESSGNLQAQQQSSDRTRRYNEIISSQTAMWATRGVQLSSGSVFNVAQQSTAAYERDIDTIELNRLNRLTSLALQGVDFQQTAANATAAAHSRMVSGISGSLLNFASSAVNAGTTAFGGSGIAPSSGQTPAGSGGVTSVPSFGGVGASPY